MSHDMMIELLKRHGYTPTMNAYTCLDVGDEGYVEDGTFYQEMGRRAHYSLRSVMSWLGY